MSLLEKNVLERGSLNHPPQAEGGFATVWTLEIKLYMNPGSKYELCENGKFPLSIRKMEMVIIAVSEDCEA